MFINPGCGGRSCRHLRLGAGPLFLGEFSRRTRSIDWINPNRKGSEQIASRAIAGLWNVHFGAIRFRPPQQVKHRSRIREKRASVGLVQPEVSTTDRCLQMQLHPFGRVNLEGGRAPSSGATRHEL
jgi:hypothetical protein